MVRKAIRRSHPKIRKPPPKRGNGTCDCKEALFSTMDWGKPEVTTKKIGRKTQLKIAVMCRFTIKCDARPGSKCVATLRAGASNPSFAAARNGNSRVPEDAGSRRVDPSNPRSLAGECSGAAVDKLEKVTYTSEFNSEATTSVTGSVTLNFELVCDTTTTRRAMRLVVENSKLDVDESDYDGDGKKNREERDDRWDPDK